MTTVNSWTTLVRMAHGLKPAVGSRARRELAAKLLHWSARVVLSRGAMLGDDLAEAAELAARAWPEGEPLAEPQPLAGIEAPAGGWGLSCARGAQLLAVELAGLWPGCEDKRPAAVRQLLAPLLLAAAERGLTPPQLWASADARFAAELAAQGKRAARALPDPQLSIPGAEG